MRSFLASVFPKIKVGIEKKVFFNILDISILLLLEWIRKNCAANSDKLMTD